ncbi:MAG: prenyltransferase/squalene oxidase repeat-containing protein [Acidimicrobiia bacterium]
MSRLRTRAGTAALAVALIATGCKWTGWSDTAGKRSAHTARNWLVTQQQADGGFEVSGFAGFETPDAVTAIAEDAQQQSTWDTRQARTAVKAVQRNGRSAMDYLDDFADGTLSAGQAAKLIVLVAKPLNYSLRSFNPQSDAKVRNLVAAVDAGLQPNGSYGAFNATLYAVIAKKLAGDKVPATTLALIRAGQQASGGWDFAADGSATDADVDTTSLAIQALVAAGVARTDASLVKGVQFLAHQQQADGAWQSFGTDDPNSTSTAVMAITAIGEDPTATCWRDRAVPALSGTAYASPTAWLRTQLASDGHVTSQNDAFPPVNTFATTQTVEALRRGWLPAVYLDPLTCP